MPRIMAAVLEAFVSTIGATRYLISLLVVVLALGYALLTQLGIVPLYTLLAAWLGLAVPTLFIVFYLIVLVGVGIVWYLWVLHPADSMRAQLSWRGVYRHTDRTGVSWLDVVLLIGLVAGAYVASVVLRQDYMQHGAIFLAVVIGFPMLIDFVPAQRPRRIAVSATDRSMRSIVNGLASNRTAPERVLNSLMIYNQFDPADPVYTEPELPEGMALEIPPRF